MGYYPSSCEEQIPAHNCDPCAPREYGRIRSVALVSNTFTFVDITDPTEWQTGINAGKIIVIPQTNGELSEPSEITGTGYGDTTETLVGYEFTAMYADPNYAENCDFYNALVGQRNFKFVYRTSSKIHLTPVTATIIPKTTIANDLNAEVVWNVTIKWKSSEFPCPTNIPEGIFDECYIQS